MKACFINVGKFKGENHENWLLCVLLLQGAHRKLLDLTSTLGLSNTVMRLIDKRSEEVI